MDNESSLELILKTVVEELWRCSQMILDSLGHPEHSGRFDHLVRSHFQFRVRAKQFGRQLENIIENRFPAYVYRIFNAFEDLARYNEPSKLCDLFQEDPELFWVYEENIEKLSGLFSIYSNVGFQNNPSSAPEVTYADERQAPVVISKANH